MAHDLYHEAQRRASLPQPIIRHQIDNSLLLSAPNNIVFELFNTIVREMSSEQLFEFIAGYLATFLASNWDNKTVQRSIERLRREQTLDVRAGLRDVPIIRLMSIRNNPKQQSPASKSPERISSNSNSRQHGTSNKSLPKIKTLSPSRAAASSPSSGKQQKSPPLNYNEDRNKLNRDAAIRQIYDHLMWRIKSGNVTQITSLLVKLALDDGYRSGKLKADLYEDVANCFEDWRSKKLIKLYAFGNAPANDQKLILAHTIAGDITKWVANFIDGSEKRQNPDLLRKLAGALRDRTKNCIFITNDIKDALSSLYTDSIRCAFVVDRQNLYGGGSSILNDPSIECQLRGGKLYIMSSLNCVQFAPDPTTDTCC